MPIQPPPPTAYRSAAPVSSSMPGNYNINQLIQLVGYDNVVKAIQSGKMGNVPSPISQMQSYPMFPPPLMRQMGPPPPSDVSQLSEQEKDREIDTKKNSQVIYGILTEYPNLVPILKNIIGK